MATNHPECNVIGRLDPKFAAAVAHACAAHDDAYHEATARVKAGLPRGDRLPHEFAWIKAAAKVSRPKAYFYGAFLLAFGWVLWWDLDRKIGL